MAGSKKKERCLRGGHMTGNIAGGSREGLQRGQVTSRGVAVKDFKGAGKHNLPSQSTDLAKLNP